LNLLRSSFDRSGINLSVSDSIIRILIRIRTQDNCAGGHTRWNLNQNTNFRERRPSLQAAQREWALQL
jgi:hypothetical protein